MITRTRGYLPHHVIPNGTYFVTFRLYDSLAQAVLQRYREELEYTLKSALHERLKLVNQYRAKIETYLDTSHGQCFLRDDRIAKIVDDAFRKYDGQWYVLHAYTIMPNHVHVLFSLNAIKTLSEIIKNWKGASSFYANKILQRTGMFWQREYFDTSIKSVRQFHFVLRYIYQNPVKAGLCEEVFHWPWNRSSPEVHFLLKRFFVENAE